jgi:hypothetical protein
VVTVLPVAYSKISTNGGECDLSEYCLTLSPHVAPPATSVLPLDLLDSAAAVSGLLEQESSGKSVGGDDGWSPPSRQGAERSGLLS